MDDTLYTLTKDFLGERRARELASTYTVSRLVQLEQADLVLALGERLGKMFSLARTILHHTPTEMASLDSPEAAALAAHNFFVEQSLGNEHEYLVVIYLDRRNKVKTIRMIYKGSVNSSQIRVGEVFAVAVSHSYSGIIVAHNHPSGDCTPSPDDVAVTRAIVQAGKLLDIDVLDHVVIDPSTPGKYISLKERGLGFS